MKDKIEQLAKGKFEYQLPEMELSAYRLELCVQAGGSYRGSFRISNSRKRRMKGVIYSDHLLFECEKQQFIGEDNEIPFVFHAETSHVGEKIEGELHIVTDVGETTLPYEVQVVLPHFHTSAGEIKDLFQFAALAKQNWQEAEDLFFREDFADTLFYRDHRYETLYGTLIKSAQHSQALEEFLIAAGKKPPVEILLEKAEYQYKAAGYPFMDKLVFRKNSWGSARFQIQCEGEFVKPEREAFSTEDFVDGRLEVGFVVQSEGLKEGIHRAQLTISSIRQSFTVPIVCTVEHKKQEQWEQRRKVARAKAGLTENYILFRSGGQNVKQYIAEAERQLAVFRNMEETDERTSLLIRLYQVHIWQASGREAAAKNTLISMGEAPQSERLKHYPEAEAAFYYLHTMQKHPEYTAEEAALRIRELYRRNPDEDMLLWYLLFLDGEYADRKQRLDAIRSHIGRGHYNPVLMFEALAVLHEEAALLHSLGTFELQILKLAAEYNYISQGLLSQLIYLAAREKAMSPLLYRILTACYDRYPEKELLSVICTLIIRNGNKGTRFFPWLKRGVEQQLRITELPEYYLFCMDEDSEEKIHPDIYLYFSYNNEISNRKKALLFANLIRNKQENMAMYRKYRRNIEEFAGAQLRAAGISSNLAVIYNDVFAEGMQNEINYRNLPLLAFMHCVTCDSEQMRSVCVRHPGQAQEQLVPLIHRRAYVNIYTEDAELFLVDKEDCYYPVKNFGGNAKEISVSVKKMLFLDDFLWQSYETGSANPALLLYLAEQIDRYQKYAEHKHELYRRLAEQKELSKRQRNQCVLTLMDYYYDNYESELFEYYLKQVQLEPLEPKERARVINLLIMRGFDEAAESALRRYGVEYVDVRRLAKLAGRLMTREEQPGTDSFLLYLIRYVFECGKCEEEQLEYLCRFYHGSTDSMYAVWKAAKNADMDAEELEESLLGQMLFAESYVENGQSVFLNYYRHGTNRKLIRAYLNYHAYKYLIKDRVLQQELFEIMEQELAMEENDICTVALLKEFSEEENLTQRRKQFIAYKLQGLIRKGIVLPFFRRFEHLTALPETMYDKYYVEYRTDPECKVKIHYMLGDSDHFEELEMQNVFCGIFVCGFVLFEEETLQYYITEEYDGREQLTESTTIVLDKQVSEGHCYRYDNLNLILAAHQMQEETTVLKLLENYIYQEYETEHLFHIIDREED